MEMGLESRHQGISLKKPGHLATDLFANQSKKKKKTGDRNDLSYKVAFKLLNLMQLNLAGSLSCDVKKE